MNPEILKQCGEAARGAFYGGMDEDMQGINWRGIAQAVIEKYEELNLPTAESTLRHEDENH